MPGSMEHQLQFFFVLLTLGTCKGAIIPYETRYFEQFVDHFNYINNETFSQRYLIADAYWRTGSDVLFLYTGNEGPIESFYDNSGFVFELADEISALVVFAEHRYYGKTLPFGADSFTSKNIGFLSSEQALADFAVLTEKLKSDYKIRKTIAFGGSYGGMLSAWMRFKYPNVVDGALAASAPIFIVADMISPTAFFGRVTKDFENANRNCPDIVRGAFNLIYSLSKEGRSGLSKITKSMKLCKTITEDEIEHLIGWVRNSFTMLAMLDYPYPASFIASLPANPVNVACNILLNTRDMLTGLADAAGLLVNGSNGTLSCYDIDKEFIECADPTGCGLGPDAMAWDYQACTEMVLRCETNNVTDMFPPKKYDVDEYCKEKWGVSQRAGWMNTFYWGKSIESSSNIIFSNGNLDPWSVGGVEADFGHNEALLIEGGAHHLDLRSSNPKDPQSVIDARKKETSIIKDWLTY